MFGYWVDGMKTDNRVVRGDVKNYIQFIAVAYFSPLVLLD